MYTFLSRLSKYGMFDATLHFDRMICAGVLPLVNLAQVEVPKRTKGESDKDIVRGIVAAH
jgi:hypothetical protein